jgi:hypothetical protein
MTTDYILAALFCPVVWIHSLCIRITHVRMIASLRSVMTSASRTCWIGFWFLFHNRFNNLSVVHLSLWVWQQRASGAGVCSASALPWLRNLTLTCLGANALYSWREPFLKESQQQCLHFFMKLFWGWCSKPLSLN